MVKLMDSPAKKIWIDLDNSPHVPFFRPIIAELEKRGYSVLLTARDCFQVCGLMNLFNLKYSRIGRHYGKNMLLKVAGLFYRAFQLVPFVMKEKPTLALSHGSRSQLILTSILRMPSILCDDYEASKGIPFIKPSWLIIPEVIPEYSIKIPKECIFKYPGIKEDVYVPDFKPDPSIKEEFGLNENKLVITVRPPADEAHYHNPESKDLFEAVINFLVDKKETQIIILPRNEKQKMSIEKIWAKWCNDKKILIPQRVINGLDLIWYSDLVISGGGTMNREAAALGVPVYSIFRGETGAVDRYLSRNGRLILIENSEDIERKIALIHRNRKSDHNQLNSITLNAIVNKIIDILEKKY